jgi:putative transcriptional regulator
MPTSSLAPGFLLASPPLGDPHFDRTVVLLAAHGPEGALGFVVNRAAPINLGELLSIAGYGDELSHTGTVYVGGPVEPSSGWLVTDAPRVPSEGHVLDVGERLRVTSSRLAFDAFSQELRDAWPRPPASRTLVVLGYSGWGPQQLEGELKGGAWLPAPLDLGILFDTPLEDRWEAAYRLLGLTPAAAVGMAMGSGGEA